MLNKILFSFTNRELDGYFVLFVNGGSLHSLETELNKFLRLIMEDTRAQYSPGLCYCWHIHNNPVTTGVLSRIQDFICLGQKFYGTAWRRIVNQPD